MAVAAGRHALALLDAGDPVLRDRPRLPRARASSSRRADRPRRARLAERLRDASRRQPSGLERASAAGWACCRSLLTVDRRRVASPSQRPRAAAPSGGMPATLDGLGGALLRRCSCSPGFVLVELLAGGERRLAGAGRRAIPSSAALFAPLPAVLAGLLLAGAACRALRARPGGALLRRDRAQPRHLGRDRRSAGAGGTADPRRAPDPVGVAAGGVMVASLWPGDAAAIVQLGAGARRRREASRRSSSASGGAAATRSARSAAWSPASASPALVFLLRQHVIPDAIVSSGWADVGAPAAAVAGLAMSLVVTDRPLAGDAGARKASADPWQAARRDRRGRGRARMPTRERPA